MTGRRSATALIISLQASVTAAAVITNVATSDIPPSWSQFRWISWVALGLVTVVTILLTIYLRRHDAASEPPSARIMRRARTMLIRRVRRTWIDGFLTATLREMPFLEPSLRSYKTAADGQQHESDIPLAQLRGAVDESLVVLGSPGAGKTTVLLEILRAHLIRADEDRSAPIPVFFLLSSWQRLNKKDRLSDWLVRQLAGEPYRVPAGVAQVLVAEGTIFPLFDGLDELDAARRDDCARSINNFRLENGLTPIVVCMRTAEFRTMSEQLHYEHAVEITSLPDATVDAFLAAPDGSLDALRVAERENPELRELLRIPLFLRMAVVARGVMPKLTTTAVSAWLLESYANTLLGGRTPMPYQKAEATRWLSYIARDLARNWNMTFRQESISNAWLPHAWQRSVIKCTLSTITGVLFAAIAWTLIESCFGTVAGAVAATLIGAYGVLESDEQLRVIGDEIWVDAPVEEQSLDTVATPADDYLGDGLAGIVIFTPLFGLVSWIVLTAGYAVAGTLSWRTPVEGGKAAIAITLCLTLPIFLDSLRPFHTLPWDATTGTPRRFSGQHGVKARQLMSRATNVAVVLGAIMMAFGWFAFQPRSGILIASATSAAALYCVGFRSVLRQWLIRLFLARSGFLPLRLGRFLRRMSAQGILIAVHDGYRFPHRLVMEHFSGRQEESLGSPMGLLTVDSPLGLRRAISFVQQNEYYAVEKIFAWSVENLAPARMAPEAFELFEAILSRLDSRMPDAVANRANRMLDMIAVWLTSADPTLGGAAEAQRVALRDANRRDEADKSLDLDH